MSVVAKDLSAFFMEAVPVQATEEFVVSDRFRDKEGKPIPWELRSLTEEENEELRKASTKRVRVKGGQYMNETNQDEYIYRIASACVVYPNLKDAALQSSYGVIGAEALLKKMLRPGECTALIQKIQELNGFDKSMNELMDEVKN
ncbi:phage tail assembly chaperone [Gorillibacterium sp. sgz5001074]|uniref:phage tail assembly chaperone n=1 Tax=Gorillibacterium sp. sgz5001074 TaxID=3446695 RepID=UPI003F68191A